MKRVWPLPPALAMIFKAILYKVMLFTTIFLKNNNAILIILLIGLLILLSACSTKLAIKHEMADFVQPAEEWNMNHYPLTSYHIFPEYKQHELQVFIYEVLRHNPDLQAIIATAKAARQNSIRAKGYALPQIDLTIDETDLKSEGQARLKTVAPAIDASWVIDVWGRLADDATALRLLNDKSQYELQQARRALIAQASHHWLDYLGKRKKEDQLTRRNIFHHRINEYYQGAYVSGLLSFDDYLNIKNQFMEHQIRLKLARLETKYVKRMMNILRGKAPNTTFDISDFSFPEETLALPGVIQATSLMNRPDILAAFSEARAFDYFARSAHKAMLPQLNLSGDVSKNGSSLKNALDGDLIWRLVGGLVQPIFRGGQLRAEAKQKSSEAEANWWQYQNVVLKAMEEVENTLSSDRGLFYQVTQQREILANHDKTLDSIIAQFSHGNVDFPQYLNAELDRIEAEIRLSDTYFKYLQNRLTLVQVLGFSFSFIDVEDSGLYSQENLQQDPQQNTVDYNHATSTVLGGKS